MGPEWKKDLRYQDDSLVTKVFLKSEALGLELRCADMVDTDLNVYIKKVEVTNMQGNERKVKLSFSVTIFTCMATLSEIPLILIHEPVQLFTIKASGTFSLITVTLESAAWSTMPVEISKSLEERGLGKMLMRTVNSAETRFPGAPPTLR